MNTFFIIGGIVVLAGITVMTVLYFRTAKELKETKEKLEEALMDVQLLEARLDAKPKHYIDLDPAFKALQNLAEACKNIKFGGF